MRCSVVEGVEVKAAQEGSEILQLFCRRRMDGPLQDDSQLSDLLSVGGARPFHLGLPLLDHQRIIRRALVVGEHGLLQAHPPTDGAKQLRQMGQNLLWDLFRGSNEAALHNPQLKLGMGLNDIIYPYIEVYIYIYIYI